MFLFLLGKCVLGDNCKAPTLELRPEHKYPYCTNIVHVLCGTFDKERDTYTCGCVMWDSSKLTEIECSMEGMALVSTITQSTSDSSYKEIPRDYFVTRGQKTNKKYMLEGEEEYRILKSEILKEINDNMKTMMILKSKKLDYK